MENPNTNIEKIYYDYDKAPNVYIDGMLQDNQSTSYDADFAKQPKKERLTKGALINCNEMLVNRNKETVCGARYCEHDCDDCNMKKIYDRLKYYEDLIDLGILKEVGI
jgi:hypothetical protein